MNSSIAASFTAKSIRSSKKEKKKAWAAEGNDGETEASLWGLDISADEPPPPPPGSASSPSRPILFDDETKTELSKLDKVRSGEERKTMQGTRSEAP